MAEHQAFLTEPENLEVDGYILAEDQIQKCANVL